MTDTSVAVPARRRRWAAASAAAGLRLLAGPAVAADQSAAEHPAVHIGESAPAQAWRKAMETGDLAALARMHDAATVAFPPDQTEVKGTDAILKGYASLFARYTVTVKLDDAHWIAQPPLVVSWGLTTLTLHPRSGGPDIVRHTRFTDAAVAVGDGWRYVVDHASMPSAR